VLLTLTEEGLYCEAGGFHIDPWKPVERAVLTHGHGDHARPGSASYVAAKPGLGVLQRRLREVDQVPPIETLAYGEEKRFGDVKVSLHPAGHVRGSAQIRVEHAGEVWVVSGDYKRAPDPTCAPFEVVPCDVFVTEATFALPVYRWRPGAEVAKQILEWWDANAAAGRASILYCYLLGKSQRILGELRKLTDPERVVYVHGGVEPLVESYRAEGVEMLPTKLVRDEPKKTDWAGRLVLAPPSVRRSPWVRRFGDHETAFASGWMQLRGARRGRGLTRGFVLSDHADWPALLRTVEETGAERILCTHGYADTLARYLREETQTKASVLKTAWEGEEGAER